MNYNIMIISTILTFTKRKQGNIMEFKHAMSKWKNSTPFYTMANFFLLEVFHNI